MTHTHTHTVSVWADQSMPLPLSQRPVGGLGALGQLPACMWGIVVPPGPLETLAAQLQRVQVSSVCVAVCECVGPD